MDFLEKDSDFVKGLISWWDEWDEFCKKSEELGHRNLERNEDADTLTSMQRRIVALLGEKTYISPHGISHKIVGMGGKVGMLTTSGCVAKSCCLRRGDVYAGSLVSDIIWREDREKLYYLVEASYKSSSLSLMYHWSVSSIPIFRNYYYGENWKDAFYLMTNNGLNHDI